MRVRWIALLILPFAVVSCSDDQPAQEPVAGDASPSAVPDAPGAEVGDTNEQSDNAPSESSAVEPAVGDESVAPDTVSTNPEIAAEAPTGSMVVTADELNVRSGPGTMHKALRVLKKGTKVSVENCTGKWCRIGENEFVSKRFLSNAL